MAVKKVKEVKEEVKATVEEVVVENNEVVEEPKVEDVQEVEIPEVEIADEPIVEEPKVEVEEEATIVDHSKKPKDVKIKMRQDHRCCVAMETYDLKKGKTYTVPRNVKNILNKAGLLAPLN